MRPNEFTVRPRVSFHCLTQEGATLQKENAEDAALSAIFRRGVEAICFEKGNKEEIVFST